MPFIWYYIEKHDGSENFLVFVISVYSLGEFFGALAFGYLHNNYSTKLLYITSQLIGLVGTGLFFIADYLDNNAALWSILISRF